MPNNAFSILSFFYNIFILITFLFKKKLKTVENKIYKYLLLLNTFNICSVLICWFTIMLRDKMPLINNIFSKLALIFYAAWVLVFTIYVYYISNFNDDKKFKRVKSFALVVFLICVYLIVTLKLNYFSNLNSAYSFGPSANVVYILTAICMILWLFMCLKNIKRLSDKKYLPVIVLVNFIIISTIIQKINPIILLTTAVESFVTVIMYFTIENPDLKMLQELIKNNEITEQTYIDKSNFLFEMTGEIREPLRNVRKTVNDLKNTKNINDIKVGLNSIDNSIRQLDFTVNDVLNVNSLDIQKVKIIDNRYNLKNLFDDMVKRIKPEINENVEFRYNMPNNIPYLYGDNIKLKQILYSLLMNAVKKTKSGFIEFNVNTIEKYEVCRVIFSIVDSGVGIGIDKINEILSVTGELSQQDIVNLEKSDLNLELCKKIIESLGGNLLIKSKIGKGTEVILTLDQKVYRNLENENIIYQSNDKKVLLVIQDKKLTSNIKKILANNSISTSHILYGMDAIDRIKSGKKYDYIILEDDMKEMSGYETLQSLKKLNNFNIPCIILLSEDKINIKDHYLNDGFKDYILISDLQDEVNRIIKKY
mgnify:FL=1